MDYPLESDYGEMRDAGFIFPGEWISPVIGSRGHPEDEPRFFGTATLIGGLFFVSARHVLEAARSADAVWLATVKVEEVNKVGDPFPLHFWQVEVSEAHPKGWDIEVGRLGEDPGVLPPFEGVVYAPPLSDVICVGYPEEAVRNVEEGDFAALNNPRFFKGYVTRRLENREDFARGPSCELSFPILEGMSGSPIWSLMETPTYGGTDIKRGLVGIATHSANSRVGVFEEVVRDAEGGEIREKTARVVEVGVAVRASAIADWPLRLADGVELGSLVGESTLPSAPPEV